MCLQMTVSIVELTNDLRPLERDPSYNPNVFSESDDDIPGIILLTTMWQKESGKMQIS